MIDTYGRRITYLRLSVTELCNLRCRYCMPEDGVCKKLHEEMMTEEEMIQAVEAAASLGITKVRITGGEPLMKKNILSICQRTAAVPGIDEVCITTNGIMLPKYAKALRKAGVRRVNISLDTLNPKKYTDITRNGKLDEALEGIAAALEAGFEKVKLNVVLLGGCNDDEIPTLADLTRKYPLDVRFIELMPMYDSGDFGEDTYVPCSMVTEMLPELIPIADDGGVARLYQFPDAQGRIGLISSINAHFCAQCNRLRLTADGKLKPCLHSSVELPVKGLDYEQMTEQIKRAIQAKPRWHGELSYAQRSSANRNMNQIGG